MSTSNPEKIRQYSGEEIRAFPKKWAEGLPGISNKGEMKRSLFYS